MLLRRILPAMVASTVWSELLRRTRKNVLGSLSVITPSASIESSFANVYPLFCYWNILLVIRIFDHSPQHFPEPSPVADKLIPLSGGYRISPCLKRFYCLKIKRMNKRKIGFIHTSPAAIAPLMQFYNQAAPDFEITNLLDDGLLRLLSAKDHATAVERLRDMISVAHRTYQVELAMVTCSSVSVEMIRQLKN